jgi:hypothetical protein
MEPAQRGLIQRGDQVPVPDLGHAIPPPLRPPASCRAADRIPSMRCESIRLKQHAADLEMNGKETHDCWQANYIAGCPS